jgi:GntR family transcriptional regulator
MVQAIPPFSAHMRKRVDVARRVRDLIRLELRQVDGWRRVLPDERVLAKQFGASRNALRDALGLLSAEGLVERRQGAGTLVRVEQLHPVGNGARGMVRALSDGPDRVRYKTRGWDVGTASPAIARLLDIEAGSTTHVSERLTFVDGVPHSLWTTHLRLQDGQKLSMTDTARDGVDIISDAVGTPVSEIHILFEAVLSDESDAPLLEVPLGHPLLRMEHALANDKGQIRAVRFGRIRSDNGGVALTARVGR